jgi:hypothetical protein
MLKFCVEQWDKNKVKLEQDIRNNLKEYNDYGYKELVKKVINLVINDKDSDYGDDWDQEHITEIDNGDYQGTLLYMIPLKTYQPSEYDYLMTYIGYGSCSGCDTLEAIRMWFWDDTDYVEPDKENKFVKDMMGLCKDLVQNIIKPYNYDWREDDKYIQIEENEK